MGTKKLQELVSNQVANAIETAKSTSANAGKSTTTKEEPKKVTLKKKTTKETESKDSTKKSVTKEVATQQKVNIIEEVVSNREVKYIYPEDCKDTLARKKWRQATRNELHRLEREMFRIQDTNSKEYKAAKKAFEDFKKTVLKPAQTA